MRGKLKRQKLNSAYYTPKIRGRRNIKEKTQIPRKEKLKIILVNWQKTKYARTFCIVYEILPYRLCYPIITLRYLMSTSRKGILFSNVVTWGKCTYAKTIGAVKNSEGCWGGSPDDRWSISGYLYIYKRETSYFIKQQIQAVVVNPVQSTGPWLIMASISLLTSSFIGNHLVFPNIRWWTYDFVQWLCASLILHIISITKPCILWFMIERHFT